MNNYVSGSNIILYKYDLLSGTDIPFAAGKSCVFQLSADMKEVTSQTSAWYREYRADTGSWNISVDGFVTLDNYSYLFLSNLQATRAAILVKFVVDNGPDGLVIYSGNVYISSLTLTGTYNEGGTYAAQLIGTGPWSSSGTSITPGGVVIVAAKRFEYTITAQSATVTVPILIGVSTITIFARGGSGEPVIIYTGTPINNEVKYTAYTGQFEVSSDNPFLEGEQIWGTYN